MSEEIKDAPKKPTYTVEHLDRQIAQTQKELAYFQDQVQRSVGLLGYLQNVKNLFDLPHDEKKEDAKPSLEVK